MTELPIAVVDLRRTDRERIRDVLRTMGLSATDEQLELLREHFHPLAEQGFDLVGQLMGSIEVDWTGRESLVSARLAEVAEEWEKLYGTAARKAVERKMLILTQGLAEHPEGWNYACLCAECREAAQ